VGSSQKFDPITVDYAIEQCTDLAVLRDLARQYRAALLTEHDQALHLLEIEDCWKCLKVKHGEADPLDACDDYKRRQKAFTDALNADHILTEHLAPAEPTVPQNCNLCRHLGHAESDHPLPKDHPQYDAFYDAGDDELASILATAIRPGREV
jgi:hypothetical protein